MRKRPVNSGAACFAASLNRRASRAKGHTMSVYADAAIDRLVKIDENHAEFVRSLVMCHKPRRVLEFGFGAGEATRAILAGLQYNRQGFEYTLVDNWFDFGGVPPSAARALADQGVGFVAASEHDFVAASRSSYDFIFSDADHHNTQEWFDVVYERMVARGGVLIYHDVTNSAGFPNLLRIYEDVLSNGYHHILLNRNSAPAERCDRGLLVIFKH
jgi:predicted O-methyltransferase YrrM